MRFPYPQNNEGRYLPSDFSQVEIVGSPIRRFWPGSLGLRMTRLTKPANLQAVSKTPVYLAILLLLLLAHPGWAQTSPVVVTNGRLELPFGAVYVPEGLEWTRRSVSEGELFEGRSAQVKVAVVALGRATTVGNDTLVELSESYLREYLPNQKIRLQSTQSAPYPWSGSLEARIESPTPQSIFLGSGSQKSLLVTASGPQAPSIANSIAGSYKENFDVKRDSTTSTLVSPQLRSMMGAASTFMLFVGFFVPVAFVLISNRRGSESRNPFEFGIKGLVVGLLCTLSFDFMVLGRLSWTDWSDYAVALLGALARFGLLLGFALYFSRRWQKQLELTE